MVEVLRWLHAHSFVVCWGLLDVPGICIHYLILKLVIETMAEFTENEKATEGATVQPATSSKGQTPEEIAAAVAKRRAELQALIDSKKAPVKPKKEKKAEVVEHKFWNTQVREGGREGEIL